MMPFHLAEETESVMSASAMFFSFEISSAYFQGNFSRSILGVAEFCLLVFSFSWEAYWSLRYLDYIVK